MSGPAAHVDTLERVPRHPRRAIAVAALGLVIAGCARRNNVDLCGRGDTGDLATALAGGRLELRFLGAGGAELARIEAPADEPSRLAVAVPKTSVRVEVTGFDAGGDPVARGEGAVDDSRACVCFALEGQHQATCAGVGCEVEAGTCRFFDEVSGGDATTRTLILGDNPRDDVAGAVDDTTLSSATGELDLNFGASAGIAITSEPATTGLIRFDLSSLPRASEIVRAELELTPCEGCAASGAIAAFPVLESWSEGDQDAGNACPSWNCRADGVAWTVPGCGFFSETNRSREAQAVAQAAIGGRVVLDVTGAVTAWAAAPATNFGVSLLVDEEGAAELASSEGAEGARPRLRVTFRLVDDVGSPPDAGPDDPDGAVDEGPEMVAVEAGAFLMGCDSATAGDCQDDELPLHAVTLSAFEIDRTEVTQEAYAACIDAGACTAPACDFDPVLRRLYPVTCVTFRQARDFCAFAGKRLPTEAEWEKAARGSDGRAHPWGQAPPDCALANAFGCAGATQPVGIHPGGASPYGALDMAGNASEYVADRYAADYYAVSPTNDPTGPATGDRRVRRGGGFNAGVHALTTYNRSPVQPDVARPHFGFRCAR